jgi:signal peptidase II
MSRKYWFLLLLTPFLVAADQGSKTAVENSLFYASRVDVLPGLVNLVYVRNPGMAFGMLNDLPETWRLPLFLLISVLAVVIIGHLFRQTAARAALMPAALALILAGAIGNLIDRFRWGYVVDFIQVHWRQHYWPTFNLADSAITVGIVLLIFDTLFTKETPAAAPAEVPAEPPAPANAETRPPESP